MCNEIILCNVQDLKVAYDNSFLSQNQTVQFLRCQENSALLLYFLSDLKSCAAIYIFLMLISGSCFRHG